MSAPSLGGVQVPRGNGDVVRLPRGASLSDFADRINANPASLVTVMFHLGEMVTATQSVSDETLQLLGAELGYTIQVVSPEDEDRELLDAFDLTFGENEGEDSDLVARPPVVTVMGHVDHGKTRLLDAIRKTSVMESEAGGITQAIGAYQVLAHMDQDGVVSDRPITFIDTPGHEAFTAMRARGANVTDIVILVVAADDGVMPQTVEALNHAQAADVPIVVAVNKIDKEGANPAKIRQQLTEYGLVAEEYGGETLFVDVSARQRIGIDELLEAVLLTADASLDLRANPDQDAQGVAIEAHLDRGRGPVATVLVQRGTLHVGDSIVSGDAFGRVRAMLDENGHQLERGRPGPPGAGARLHLGARRRRQLPGRRRGPGGPADRRAAAGPRAQRAAGPVPAADLAGRPGPGAQGGRGRAAQPHPQGRRLRLRGGARGRAAEDRGRATRCRCGSSTAASAASPRTTSTWRRRRTRSSSASTCGRSAGRRRPRTARAWRSGTTRSSTRPSRRSRPRSRACSSRSSRRRSSAPRRSARSSGCRGSATSPVASSGPA